MDWMRYLILLGVTLAVFLLVRKAGPSHRRHGGLVPVSLHYHFTRRCNKTCSFCFHTAKTSHIERPERAKEGLRRLKQAGTRKINFAGGEPFLYPKFLGEMIDFCKETLQMESISIVTNGSLVKESFFEKHGRNVDILSVSCDSFDETTNIQIGRGSGDQVRQLYQIATWCHRYGVKFKINTVVCRLNYQEDMNQQIETLQPFRWKCYQVLIVPQENDSAETLRDARELTITADQFESFRQRHIGQKSMVAEPNQVMAQSYLILDEFMRFLDKDGAGKSESILKVGVQKALESIYWDEKTFHERGGIYDWTREKSTCSDVSPELDW